MNSKQPRIISIAFSLVLGSIFALIAMAMSADITMITKDDLKTKLGNKDVVVLDVRMDVEWQSSDFKIKGAVWENATDVEIWANKYPKDKTLVLYCA